MKLKRIKIIELQHGIQQCGNLRGSKFAYIIAKNLIRIKEEVEALDKVREESKAYREYTNKRVELCIKYAEKDENGVALIRNNRYVGVDGNPEFEKELEVLKGEYKTALDEYDRNVETYNSMLDEEIEIPIQQIERELIPENITVQAMTMIMPMIKDEGIIEVKPS